MRTQKQYEDAFHDLIYKILPNIKPDNIRPMWNQNEGYFGENNIDSNPGEQNGLKGFTKKSNFIFFNVILNTTTRPSETNNLGIVNTAVQITLNVAVYGPESPKNALKLISFVRALPGQQWCDETGIYLDNVPSSSRTIKEPYRSEIWVRQDLTITFNELIEFNSPNEIIEVDYANKGEINNVEVDRNDTY